VYCQLAYFLKYYTRINLYARAHYTRKIYTRARILRICSCLLYVLLREGGEWILSIRPGRGGHGPRRNLGGSDAQADRSSRLPSVFFVDLPHGSGGTPGSSAEGASKPLEPGREAPRRVSRFEPGAKRPGE
jgi:hypothetical protein